MGTIAEKLTYLNTTKTMLRDSLNKFGSNILTTDTFRSYDTKLNEIYDKLPKITQSGAGFTLSDVQNGLVDDFKMNGVDLQQNSYTGKNLFDKDNKNVLNAFFTAASPTITSSNSDRTIYLSCEPNTTYTIQKKTTGYRRSIGYTSSEPEIGDTVDGTINIPDGQTSGTITTGTNARYLVLRVYNTGQDANTTFTQIVNTIQIEKGSTATDYEPYTGGIPSPNPSYPQEIKVVEGRQVITDSGKNLLNISKNVNGYWYRNGVLTANGDWSYINDFIEVKPNIQYTISRDSSELNESQFSIEEFDENKNYIKQNVLWQNNTNKYSITTDSNTKYVICNYRNGYAHTNLQFEPGDNRTDFEPYYEPVSYNIDLNSENLSNGINQNYWLNTATTSCGNANNNSGLAIDVRNLDVVEISTSEIQQRYRVACLNSLPQASSQVAVNKGINKDNTSSSITINTAGYNYLVINATDLTKINVYYKYELAKIPNTDYKNRIYKSNGNWYYEENVKKIVLDGNRNWIRHNNTRQLYYLSTENLNILEPTNNSETMKGLSDYFISLPYYINGTGDLFENEDGMAISNEHKLYFGAKSISSVSDLTSWKAWLSNNNVTLWYPLVNPVTTQITNTTLINQLEAISVHTGTNIFTISNDNNIIPEIEITRLKELDKLN